MNKTIKSVIILFVLTLLLLQANIVSAESKTQDFDDIKTEDWFYNAVKEAQELGIVAGVGNNRYAPNEIISYAQYLTVTVRLVDPDIESKPTTGNWYDKYIQRAMELGVVDENEQVDPIQPIPREEMMRYTCKALGIQPYESDDIIFQDVALENAAYINAAYKEYLTEGTEILGKDKRIFGYGETATRAQLAAMALRIKEYMDDPIAYKENAIDERLQKEAAKSEIALLGIEDRDLWHMAASYGDFNIVENYQYAGKTFNKAVTVFMEEDSVFPSGEVFMVIINTDKKYKTLCFDAWIEKVSKSSYGLGFFHVKSHPSFETILELSEIPVGEVKTFEADISESEEIWIYTGLEHGSKVGFANVRIK